MATARKTSLARALKPSLQDFFLQDLRTVSLKCERFMRPEKVTTGSYSVSARAEIKVPALEDKGEKIDGVAVLIKLEVVGQSVGGNKERGKDSPDLSRSKSFSINLAVEATFSIKDKAGVPGGKLSEEILTGLLSQINPLAMNQVRCCVAEMGFSGFRPKLGYRSDKSKVFTETSGGS
jgi:hypothetical protein